MKDVDRQISYCKLIPPYDELLSDDATGLSRSLSTQAFSDAADRHTRAISKSHFKAEGGKNTIFPKDSVFPLRLRNNLSGEAK